MWTKLALRRLRSSHYSGKMITAFNKLVFLGLAPNFVYQSVNSIAYFVFRSFWSYHAIQICILFYGNIKKDAKKNIFTIIIKVCRLCTTNFQKWIATELWGNRSSLRVTAGYRNLNDFALWHVNFQHMKILPQWDHSTLQIEVI